MRDIKKDSRDRDYYGNDFVSLKFPIPERELWDWKELTKDLSDKELLSLRAEIEKRLFEKLGS